jgi:hypothetical protein
MPLPNEFSSWEHLQSTFMRVHNEMVRDEFRDITDDDDISVPRGSLKVACLMRDDDSAIMSLHRIWLLMGYLRRASDMHPHIYAIPVEDYQGKIEFRPQVILRFCQDLASVADNKIPVESRVSFRLMNETPESLTKPELERLGAAIGREFGAGGGYRFSRGKKKFIYLDRARGYDFRLHVTSETEAKEVIRKTMEIRGHIPDWDNLTSISSNKNYPENPGTKLILGKPRTKPRQRPTAIVRYQYAEMHVHGMNKSVILHDRTGFYRKVLNLA